MKPQLALAGTAVAGAAMLGGCSSGKPARIVTVTVTPSHHTTPTTTPAGSPAASSAPVATPPGTTPTQVPKLTGTCETLLPLESVQAVLGRPPLAGATAFVVGKPEPDIGRIGYVNCRYGVTGAGAAAVPAVEIGLSLYSTPSRASTRIAATVDDYTAHGATSADTSVDGHPATILTGGFGAGYTVPLLVVAAGQRTVAVSVAPTVASGDKAATAAKALATLALKRSGG